MNRQHHRKSALHRATFVAVALAVNVVIALSIDALVRHYASDGPAAAEMRSTVIAAR